MKYIKKLPLLIIILIYAFTLNVKAISFNLDITGDSSVAAKSSINLKAEYWVGNDMPQDNQKTGEISRDDVTNKVKWRSSDEEIATVDETGKVTGLKYGEVIITASYDLDGTNRVAIHNVYVFENEDEDGNSEDEIIITEPSDIIEVDVEENNNKGLIICIAVGVVVVISSLIILISKRKHLLDKK